MTILLAEDNRADIYVVRKSLEEHGIQHDITVARDGDEAVRFIDRADQGGSVPSVVLLDLNLPRRSGKEVLQRLRSSTRCAAVPVVILTSSDSPLDRAEAAHLGASAYFRKPSELDEFMRLGEVVKQVIES